MTRLAAALLLLAPLALTAAEPAGHTIAVYNNLLLVTAPAPAKQLPAGLLRQRLTVDFQDTPMNEVADLLRGATGLNVVVAPGVLASGQSLTLAAKDMELGHLLKWVRTIAKVDVGWVDGALYLSDVALRAPQATRVYDVSDLTMTIADFPGPDLSIPASGGQGAVLVPALPDERAAPTAEDLVALIEKVIAP